MDFGKLFTCNYNQSLYESICEKLVLSMKLVGSIKAHPMRESNKALVLFIATQGCG